MRRFIAGASCPRCNQQDCLFFDTSEVEDRVHCSRCDYSELRAGDIVLDYESDKQKTMEESPIKWQ